MENVEGGVAGRVFQDDWLGAEDGPVVGAQGQASMEATVGRDMGRE